MLLLAGVLVIGVLIWIIIFMVAQESFDEDSDFATAPTQTPTERPPREDVPELSIDQPTPTRAPSLTPVPGVTEVAAEPTIEPTPTAAFTLSGVDFGAPTRLPTLDSVGTPIIPEGGAYPIQLAIAERGVFSPVVAVQTDRNFDIIVPEEEIGYYALTPKIGAGGNTVMIGHVAPGLVFNNLLDVEIGDIIRVRDENFNDHYYQVHEYARFPFDQTDPENITLGMNYMYLEDGQERLTLVTCYPENTWTHRFVVRAVPIPPPTE